MPTLSVQFQTGGLTSGFLGVVSSGRVTFTFTTEHVTTVRASIKGHSDDAMYSVANGADCDGAQSSTLAIDVRNDLPLDYTLFCVGEDGKPDAFILTARIDW